MAHLKLTHMQAITLKGIRTVTPDRERKDLKKAAFSDIKTRLGIPASTRLTVEIDDTSSPDYLVLKQKGSGHKLLADAAGRYAGVDVPAPVVPPAPAVQPASSPAADSRFTSANPTGLKKIGRVALLGILRDYGDGDISDVQAIPQGMPALAQDGLVLDNQTGDLYFRA
jgi:hypothetical protein